MINVHERLINRTPAILLFHLLDFLLSPTETRYSFCILVFFVLVLTTQFTVDDF